MPPHTTDSLVSALSRILLDHRWKIVTAESCTGGAIAQALTRLPGSSQWFDCGFVTYSNSSKEKILGVNHTTLLEFGAVSEQTAHEMAIGALKNSQAQLSIAVTGITGPTGATRDKPVGTVWFAWTLTDNKTESRVCYFQGDRESVREQSVQFALQQLLEKII